VSDLSDSPDYLMGLTHLMDLICLMGLIDLIGYALMQRRDLGV